MKTLSPELSKELKVRGFSQDARFYWKFPINCESLSRIADLSPRLSYVDNLPDLWVDNHSLVKEVYEKNAWKVNCEVVAAPFADEIFEQLPAMILFEDTKFYLVIEKIPHSNHFEIVYMTEGEYPWTLDNGDCRQSGETLANAGAQMYLYLVKEGFIK